ncbi:hypothetical protein ABK040_010667 [Willaertia magna]
MPSSSSSSSSDDFSSSDGDYMSQDDEDVIQTNHPLFKHLYPQNDNVNKLIRRREEKHKRKTNEHLPLLNKTSSTTTISNAVNNKLNPSEQKTLSNFKERFKKLPKKTGLAALILFLSGLIFLLLGMNCFTNCKERKESIGWFVLSFLTIIPGIYSVFILLNVLLFNDSGYSFEDLPSFDDDD